LKQVAGLAALTSRHQPLYALTHENHEKNEAERSLFLAVDSEAYASLFNEADGRDLIASRGIKLIVFHPIEKEILRWIE
jgi:hypothetical protein